VVSLSKRSDIAPFSFLKQIQVKVKSGFQTPRNTTIYIGEDFQRNLTLFGSRKYPCHHHGRNWKFQREEESYVKFPSLLGVLIFSGTT